MVKEILRECVTCRKLNSISFDYPKLTNLPHERVSLVKPFLHTGIDYTSHIFVNDDAGNSVKMYIVLYTCLGLRCIHLDLFQISH